MLGTKIAIGSEPFQGWVVTEQIGTGSFGKVFKAEKDGGISAIKQILIPDDEQYQMVLRMGSSREEIYRTYKPVADKLAREIKIMRDLSGEPGIMIYQDHEKRELKDRAGYEIIIRMEYLTPLDLYMVKNGISVGKVIKLGIELCDALGACHKSNIIHRDIKESNIFLDGRGRFKLGDFGVSKNFDTMDYLSTKTGTRGYMAPEVERGNKYDYRADIYSLGIVIYKLLNGNRMPFLPIDWTIEDLDKSRQALLEGRTLPDPIYGGYKLASIIRKACAFQVSDRFESAEKLKKELQAVLNSMNETELAAFCVKTDRIGKTGTINIQEDEAEKKITVTDEQLFSKAIEYQGLKRYKEAYDIFITLAEGGHSGAQFELGRCYEYGKGTSKNAAKAVEWYTKAAVQGHAEAQYYLGYCYAYGEGISKNEAKALEWYKKSAVQGNASAQNNLGYCYQFGKGTSKDDSEAIVWYRKSAMQGNAGAQYNLAICYENGLGIKKDEAEALKWYMKAAGQGHAKSQFEIGGCYEFGKGVTKDEIKAVQWYRKSAEQGYAEAQNVLGYMLSQGKGVTRDPIKAFEWYKKAAEQGHKKAQFNLGYAYANGIGVAADYSKAIEWYIQSGDMKAVIENRELKSLAKKQFSNFTVLPFFIESTIRIISTLIFANESEVKTFLSINCTLPILVISFLIIRVHFFIKRYGKSDVLEWDKPKLYCCGIYFLFSYVYFLRRLFSLPAYKYLRNFSLQNILIGIGMGMALLIYVFLVYLLSTKKSRNIKQD